MLKQPIPAQFAEDVPGITALSSSDAVLFREAFQKEAICYANSWLYLLRSTRGEQGEYGYKFMEGDTLAGIGYRHHTFYIVHPQGDGRCRSILNLCMWIHTYLHRPIVLKKIDRVLYEYLATSPLFQAVGSDLSLLEEEAYPEHVLQLQTLFNSHVPADQQPLSLLKKVRRFDRSMKLIPLHTLSHHDLVHSPGFQDLFGVNSEKHLSYRQIMKEIDAHPENTGRYKVCAYYDERGTIHGFYVSERLAEGVMGLYCAVSSKAHPGITEWMDYDFFQQLYQEGIQLLYLGGSETGGVDTYVKKLLPIAPPYLMRPLHMPGNDTAWD